MKKKIPASALRFEVKDFTFGDNGDDAASSPIRVVARSREPVENCCWGKVIHDLSGVKHKGRIAVDWCHDRDQVIGFINKFSVEDEGLVLSGALTPYKDNDKAAEIAFKSKKGVPYEASIFFAPSHPEDLKIEEYSEGLQVEVNGETFDGPITVIREWPLRGLAICPYGKDSNTASEIFSDENGEVEIDVTQFTEEGHDGGVDGGKKPESTEMNQDVDTGSGSAADADESSNKDGSADKQEKQGDGTMDTKLFVQFCEKFGDAKAAEYFKQGLSLEEAQAKFSQAQTLELAAEKKKNTELAEENKKLKDAAATGAPPVRFDGGGDDGAGGSGGGSDEPTEAQLAKHGLKAMEWYEEYCEKTHGDPKKLYEYAKKEAMKKLRKAAQSTAALLILMGGILGFTGFVDQAEATALTEGRNTQTRDVTQIQLTVKNDEVIYAGGIVSVDTNGEAVAATDTASDQVIGRAVKTIDNADDGLTIDVDIGTFLWVNNASFTDANIGDFAYVEDDQTATNSGNTILGVIVDVDSGGVWVKTMDVDRTAGSFTTLTASGASSLQNVTISGWSITAGTTTNATLVVTGASSLQNLSVSGWSDVTGAATNNSTTALEGIATFGSGRVLKYVNKTANYTATTADDIISYNTAASTTNTLPEASSVLGQIFTIALQDDDGDLVVDTDGTDTFDGTNNRMTFTNAVEGANFMATAADVYTVFGREGGVLSTQ